MRSRSLLAALLFTAVFGGAPASALVVAVQPIAAAPGDTPDVCVAMPDNDGTVSGLQLDMIWDASCLTIETAGTEGACSVNPQTNRSTFRTRVQSETRMRALMLSIDDPSPMPADARQLFCCQFRVAPDAGGRSCSINLTGVILSDPSGNSLPVTPRSGVVLVAGEPAAPGVGGFVPPVGGGGVPSFGEVPPAAGMPAGGPGGSAPPAQQAAPAAGPGTGAGSAAPAAAGAPVGGAPAAPAPGGVPVGGLPGAAPGGEAPPAPGLPADAGEPASVTTPGARSTPGATRAPASPGSSTPKARSTPAAEAASTPAAEPTPATTPKGWLNSILDSLRSGSGDSGKK